ncbi:MAG: class I SAM-dependent methyltransferase [Phycisphaerales bacterium]
MNFLRNPSSSDPVGSDIRKRLDAFYGTTHEYHAFLSTPNNTRWHGVVDVALQELLQKKPRIACLEVGAGRSDFAHWLGDRRDRVEYHAHDITDRNAPFLSAKADRVWFGDISRINDKYDLVFHFFVLEHVTNPSEFLAQIDNLLLPGGIHVIVCPRYDVLGYICPSVRHLNKISQIWFSLQLSCSRLMACRDKKPRFWINADPAVFHKKWFRDADAIHLVSLRDVEWWHQQHGFSTERSWPPGTRFKERAMQLVLRCRKHEQS